MSNKHVYIATPTHDGNVRHEYAASMFNTSRELDRAGITVTWAFQASNALVHDARNRMAAWFMESDATDLLFIDADMAWEPAGVLQLVNSPHDVIGGAYRRKTDEAELYNVAGLEPGPTRLVKCDYIGTGFLKISRKALLKLRDAYPAAYADPDGKPIPALFDTDMSDGKLVGEDALFCRRWRKIGGTVFCDPDIMLWHFGVKSYGGNFSHLVAQAEAAA